MVQNRWFSPPKITRRPIPRKPPPSCADRAAAHARSYRPSPEVSPHPSSGAAFPEGPPYQRRRVSPACRRQPPRRFQPTIARPPNPPPPPPHVPAGSLPALYSGLATRSTHCGAMSPHTGAATRSLWQLPFDCTLDSFLPYLRIFTNQIACLCWSSICRGRSVQVATSSGSCGHPRRGHPHQGRGLLFLLALLS
jgi:hypothetical protein